MTAPLRPHPLTRSRLLIVLAALLWSTSGLFLKSPPLARLTGPDSGPLLACYRALFAAACLLPLVRVRAIRWRPQLLPMVVSFAAMNLLFVTAMTKTTAAATVFLQYTSTAWAFLFGVLFLRERVERGNVVAMLTSLCGIAWIVTAEGAGTGHTGNLMALGSGVAYAGVIVSLRALRDEDAAWLVALSHLVAGVVLLPWALAGDIALTATQWCLVALLGVLQMGVPYVLFARGIRRVSAQEAALIVLLEPVLNPLWVWLLWREEVSASTWTGGGVIVGGLAIRYLIFRTR